MRHAQTVEHRSARRAVRDRGRSSVALLVAASVSVSTMIASVVDAPGTMAASPRPLRAVTVSAPAPTYPVGVFDYLEPSGLAPPAPSQLPGYTEAYVDDFNGPLDLSKWGKFNGVPKGDPAGRFEFSHTWADRGLLHIGTWRDPSQHNRWATGGICLCGVPLTYGAFFVRSRVTAGGTDAAQLLWPANNSWPPELDFNESGVSPMTSTWTDHYSSAKTFVQSTRTINVRHWHTWGVVWTPTSVTFVVDGQAWGQLTAKAQIPNLPMTLDLQQQTWCGIQPECPKRPSTMLVDWVVAFTPTA
jgi:hypothetical protein